MKLVERTTPADELPQLCRVDEAALWLGVGRGLVFELCRRGDCDPFAWVGCYEFPVSHWRPSLTARTAMSADVPSLAVTDIRWTLEPVDWLVGVDARVGWGAVLVRLLHIIRAKNEIVSVALETIREQERELAAARRRHLALIDEYRSFRARVMREATL